MFGAVDIGGTKTLVAVFDAHGKIKEEQKFPTPVDYHDFATQLANTVAKLSTTDLQRIGVAVPGLLNRQKGVGIAFGNLPWKNVPIQADCEVIFKAPVVIENDAKLAGLSEALQLPKYNKVLYLTISTGIGGSLVIDGKLDPNFVNIEVGQMILEHKGEYMIWEHFASGKAIVETYGKRASELDDVASWHAVSKNLAKGIINLIAALTPDVIVIGGGVGAHFKKFGPFLQEELEHFKNPLVIIPPIVQAKRPEEAVVYGCFELAKQHHEKVHGRVAAR